MAELCGVNLGGWLIVERWMTPSLFAGTDAQDEYTFMQTPDALEKLRDHQRDFIREDDFKWMHDNGVNAVRIPVGYWLFEGAKPYVSCIGRLDWAVRMAKKYDIKVLICLHGAPGSQNGQDHSGHKGAAEWYDHEHYRQRTIEVLKRLAEYFHKSPVVWGIELLNEPKLKPFNRTLRTFYVQAYREIIKVGRPGLRVVFSDAATPRLMSGALRAQPGFPVVMDHHWYHFFLPKIVQRTLPLEMYYRFLQFKRIVLERLSKAQPIIIGEWSGIIGGERLSRYPQSQHGEIIDRHIEEQLKAWANLEGWFYWSYKHESPGVFNFRSMVENGRIKIDSY